GLWYRAFGNVDVNVELFESALIDVQLFGARLRPRQRGLRGFLHHVAQLTGQHQRALPRGQQNFDKQHVAARGCPRESGRNSDLILLEHLVRINMRDAEKLVKPICSHTNERIVPYRYAASDLAADACDLAFEFPTPCLAGVLKDDRLERGPANGD